MSSKRIFAFMMNGRILFRTLIFALFLLSAEAVVAQQEPQFTMFWNNYALFNPAETGVNYKHYAALSYRNQWTDLSGNPVTAAGNYSYRFDSIPFGIGVGYLNDVIGHQTSNRVYCNVNYMLRTKLGQLGLGVSGVYSFVAFDYSGFTGISPNDPLIPNGVVSQGKVFGNIGLYFKSKSKNLELGISSTQINEPNYNKLYYQLKRHYFLFGAYNFKLTNMLQLKSRILIKSNGQSTQVDLNNVVTYNSLYWFGATFRPNDAVGVHTGVNINKKFNVGYNYDYTISELKPHVGSTHEVLLSFMLN